jgi:8-oxo-dGTP pyrophosphatase MutT (NUDIX family)
VPRLRLLEMLESYGRTWASGNPPCPGWPLAAQGEVLARFRSFVAGQPDCLERSHAAGHVTASAMVATADLEQVLLTMHRRLNIWIQLGGHADGEDLACAALREAREESGLADLRFLPYEAAWGLAELPPLPFDLDIHAIPARPGEPEHLHYDVRFLLTTSRPGGSRASAESVALGWFTLDQARRLTSEASMQRQFDKLESLKFRL